MFPMAATLNTMSGRHRAVIGNIFATFPVLTVKTFRCHTLFLRQCDERFHINADKITFKVGSSFESSKYVRF